MNAAAPRETSALEPCRVSIIIKTLNEEEHIEDTIESALRAIAAVDGEVILADSFSTDSTVKRAMRYPVRIVQLSHAHERCCGVGPQLGYQYSRGAFVYILDGDMQMQPGFLEAALAFMVAHDDVAGVGGNVVEKNTKSLEYIARSERISAHRLPGLVDRLDGGGVYRRSAIEAAGYLSDRNLHSYEEFDLGTRLRVLGWKLWRLPIDAVSHFGHDTPPYQLLMRRWRTRYICGLGELIRVAASQSRLAMVWRGVRELQLYTIVIVWWAALLSVALWPLPVSFRLIIFIVIALTPLLAMMYRKRSVAKGVYSIVSWCFNAAGLVRGVLHVQLPVREAISSNILRDITASSLSRISERVDGTLVVMDKDGE